MWVETAFIAVLGLLMGSFANVVIYRVPRGESVVSPRSRCPGCLTPIRWYDNVPVLSWLALLGRCRKCRAPISIRYPLVETLTSLAFAAVFHRFGLSWTTLEYTYFVWALIVVSFIDVDHMILPDVFTLSGVVIGLAGAAINPERSFLSSLVGTLIGGGFLWLIAYLYYVYRKEEGMGGGDIKLLAWIGAILGWKAVPFVILCSSVVGSLVGILVALRSSAGLKSVIPFGPYLAIAAVLYMLGGDVIGAWYIGLFLPASTSVN